ncbi:hypothetical protein MMP61_18835 [Acinetobacter sp. NIPH 1958]|uniref:hypothetical protein n=1 Tax=Acinetobacter sp. NIPH 1958 TaxID=2923430 RepID=UPI001F4A122E|nr:hypothetical protein [Acinetobacter sp. NIPH 1958]MCH7357595.1 hypothetical protein [Acinetobacter sp. NIPH 1958]
MARYQYAKDQLGQIVRAIDLVGKEQQSDFICLGCDNILIAKVNGKIKQPLMCAEKTGGFNLVN